MNKHKRRREVSLLWHHYTTPVERGKKLRVFTAALLKSWPPRAALIGWKPSQHFTAAPHDWRVKACRSRSGGRCLACPFQRRCSAIIVDAWPSPFTPLKRRWLNSTAVCVCVCECEAVRRQPSALCFCAVPQAALHVFSPLVSVRTHTLTHSHTHTPTGYSNSVNGNLEFPKANNSCQVRTSLSCTVCVPTSRMVDTHTHTYMKKYILSESKKAPPVFWCQPWWMGNRNIWFAIVTR